MAPSKVLDSHIHLWPSTSVSPTDHGWMTPGHFLAKRHGIAEYKAAISKSSVQPSGFIYVETDRYLPTPSPEIHEDKVRDMIHNQEARNLVIQELENWAHEPLQELEFLRRIIEATPQEGDGFEPGDNSKMVGCVVWAPFHISPELFDLYLQVAESVSGPLLWQRIVGFRYLVQGIKDENTLRRLLQSKAWLANILRLRTGRGGKGWTFDIGVDTHAGGVWQVEAAGDLVETIRELEKEDNNGSVKFILNHLCKPDLSLNHAVSSKGWLAAMKRLAAHPAVYMKLSGAFNEFAPSPTPDDVSTLLERLRFYTGNVFELFGSERVMFGSDWPVCNVGGPAGDGNWNLWRDVVNKTLEEFKVAQPEDVWWKAACEGYGVEI